MWRLLLLVGLVAATVPDTHAQGKPDAACSAVALASEDLELDRQLREPLSRYPWLGNALPICAALASGKAGEQLTTFSGCLAKTCTDQRGASCSDAADGVVRTIRTNAAARAAAATRRARCAPRAAAAGRTPLETHAETLLASQRGDAAAVRRLSVGSDDDIALGIRMSASTEAFFRAPTGPLKNEVAELARLVQAAGGRSVLFDPKSYREEISGNYATLTSADGVTVFYFKRVDGEWKSDFARQQAKNPNAAAGALVAQLVITAWQLGTDAVSKGRAFAPVAVGAVNQCILLGMFIVTTSLDQAKENCAELMAKRFPDDSPPRATSAPGPASSGRGASSSSAPSPSSTPATADVAAIDAAVDRAFTMWERAWFTDRYVHGSAHAQRTSCQASTCRADGGFAFSRGGSENAATFSAALEAAGSGFTLTRLCYQDPTTGMSECMR